jgi:CRISPR system Cascade subunit CasD
MAFLVFQLYGDMASWGDIAVGEQRPSHPYPTKSAILGLLCAAQGITRHEDAAMVQLNAEVKMAIQLFHRGHFLTDYHTIQAAPQVALKKKAYTRKEELEALSRYQAAGSGNSGTILSSREYRMEAYYRVALHADRDVLKALETALKEPVFVPYLGRKACPLALPMAPQVIYVDTFEMSFGEYNPTLALPLSREGTETGSSRASDQVSSADHPTTPPFGHPVGLSHHARSQSLPLEDAPRLDVAEPDPDPDLAASAEGNESSRASEPQVSAALDKKMRGLGGEIEYIWEAGCPTQLQVHRRTIMRSIPISRQRWQFQDQPIFHGYREANHVH